MPGPPGATLPASSKGRNGFPRNVSPRGSRRNVFMRFLNGVVARVEPSPAVLAAKRQRTPCGAGRIVMLCVYIFYAFLTARIYFAWPNLSNLLFRAEAYVWLCDEQLAAGFPDLRLPENGGKRYACEEQDSAVGSLFVTCLAFAFSFSLAAGLLLDYLGPRVTAIVGQLFNGLAWLLLAFASEKCPTYYAAFIFMGIGSDIGYLPLLSVANLFPGHEGLIVAILGASKSASFAVPTILDTVEATVPEASLSQVAVGYALLGPGVCLLLACLLVPYHHFRPWNEFLAVEDGGSYPHPIQRVNDSFASYEAHVWRDSFSSFHEGQWHLMHETQTAPPASGLPASERVSCGEVSSSSRRGRLLPTLSHQPHSHNNANNNSNSNNLSTLNNLSNVNNHACCSADRGGPAISVAGPVCFSPDPEDVAAVDQTGLVDTRASDTPLDAEAPTTAFEVTHPGARASSLSRAPSKAGSNGAAKVPETTTLGELVSPEETPVGFFKQFSSSYGICIVVYSIVKAVLYAFFTTAGENLLGKEVNDFMGTALPFSLVPCIVIGKVVDVWGIMPVLFFLNLCITLAYGLSMIPTQATAYISALLYTCYVSFYSSQSYCFVSDTFSARHFGKIVGTIHLIAGFLSLLKIPMQKMVVNVFHSVYYYPCLIMLALCGFNFAVLLVLLWRKRKDPHPFWPAAARELARREAESKRSQRQHKWLARKKATSPRPATGSAALEEIDLPPQEGNSASKPTNATPPASST